MSVKVNLPWPPAILNPNSRGNWRARAAAAAAYREDCGFAALEVVQKLGASGLTSVARARHQELIDLQTKPVVAKVTFWPPTRRRRDEDNLRAMMKPAWDGLQDAHLISGDHVGVFRVESTHVKDPLYGLAGVEVELTT